MANNGYIKLYRCMMDWEWYGDEKIFKFFCHAIFRANISDVVWNGIVIPRGSFISSYQKLALDLNFSIKQIRGIVNKLISTGEMAKSSTTKYTMFTVINYDKYQGTGQSKGQTKGTQQGVSRANKGQQDKNKRINKEDKEGATRDFPSGITTEEEYERWLYE